VKFYTLKEVPVARDDRVFKASPLGSAIALVISFAITIALVALGRSGGYFSHGWNVPPFITYWIAFVSGCAVLFGIGSLRARLKPTNWLLRCNQSGIIIKYRAYQNWRMPAEDVQAVELAYSEIAWARETKERRTSPGTGKSETQIEFLTYLDFGLVNPDTAPLEEKLAEERNRRWAYRNLSYPVNVSPGGIVRVLWRSSGSGISSSPDEALRWLGQFVKIEKAISTKVNLTYQPNLDPQEQDAKIRLLAQSGKKVSAIKLARKIYGYSVDEAKKHVGNL
jgi:hypothetical protein